MKRSDFQVVNDFFDLISSNSNFNKIFYTENRVMPTEICSFTREGTTASFKLPFIANTHSRTYLITKISKSYFMYYLENHFKMTKDGNILIVPMITFFEHQKNEHVFAFNIYNQTIHLIRNEEFYFEDLFENNEVFNAGYHGDVFVDQYINNYILNTLEDDDSIRQELILYPPEQLSSKIDLLSMYMI